MDDEHYYGDYHAATAATLRGRGCV
eukprot:COSAG02_NODE_47950_length_337_cov_1.071429_1_plen_24_part_10